MIHLARTITIIAIWEKNGKKCNQDRNANMEKKANTRFIIAVQYYSHLSFCPNYDNLFLASSHILQEAEFIYSTG